MENPTIDIDLAAKTRASVLEKGEAGFDMEHWHYSNCETTACIAGHCTLAAGLRPAEAGGFNATRKLLGMDKSAGMDTIPSEFYSDFDDLFLMTDASREEVIEEFDRLVEKYCPEGEFESYLRKSYGYIGTYRKRSLDR